MASTTQPFFFLSNDRLKSFPFESYFKILVTIYVVSVNLSIYWTEDNRLEMSAVGFQHLSGYVLFAIQAAVEILTYHGRPCPLRLDYFFFVSAEIMRAVLWKFHIDNKTELDNTVHYFIFYVLVARSVALLVEVRDFYSYWPVFVRCLLTLMQGTWTFQVAFVFNPHTTNVHFQWSNSVYDQQWLSIFFAAHALFCFTFVYVEYFLVYFTYPLWASSFKRYLANLETSTSNLSNNLTEQAGERRRLLLEEFDLIPN